MYGERLKIARKQNKLSQEEVAEIINISRSSISKFETETQEPNIETLKRLCELYEVSADYIIGIRIKNKNRIQIINQENNNNGDVNNNF